MELNRNILTILNGRGITSDEEIEEYFSSKPKRTYDPFLLHDMEEGVDLILSAVEMGKNICIYGDYDTDGVTSVTLLRDVLLELGAEVSYYIPSRMDEGYGLNNQALDKIKSAGAELVITVDCGATSVSEVEYAKEIGLDIMITDHHTMKDDIPDCILINPRHPECEYPFKGLAGVGVAFKLAQALVETAGLSKDVLTRNLDLVSIGTIGDVVPLVDENRMLTKYGLRTINLSSRLGLNALIERSGLHPGEIVSRSVSFVISPHINAAGRMNNATLAARLMQTEDKEKANELAEELSNCNQERKRIQQSILDECIEIANESLAEGKKCIIALPSSAHEGIIGIVAGQLKERYGLPSMVLVRTPEGEIKGSGRSPDGINLFEVLNRHPELFLRYGGHAAACGFTIKPELIDEFRDAMQSDIGDAFSESPDLFTGKSNPEIILAGKDVTDDFLKQQSLMEPFGKDNPKPLIGVNLSEVTWERMGNQGQYLRLSGKIGESEYLRCVDFRHADESERVLRSASNGGEGVLAVGHLDEKIWNDRKYIQMEIDYLRENMA